ncbi:MAG: polysaccharide deacetylase family protein [bacterium]|nr:polysaccharide deacetylase family protein [bacterium]
MSPRKLYITAQRSTKNKQIAMVLLCCAVFVMGIVLYLFYSINKKRDDVLQTTIAPYYQSKEFKIPKDVITPVSTSSAEIKILNQYRLPIIMYHYVEYVKDMNDTIRKRLDITPNLFEGHLQALHDANYKTYFAKDIYEILNGSVVQSSKSIVLTFDDGYEDFYTDVFPLLKKYQMKATLYVIYNFIDRKGFIKDAQIRELISSGLVEIGSHTFDHLYLKTVSNEVAIKQIIDSKKKFEERYGIEIKTFAYPFGAFNKDTIELVKKAGYTAALSVIPGIMQSKTNQFYLFRIRPSVFTPKTIVSVLENYKK